MIKLSIGEWHVIQLKIKEEFPPSYLLIRETCKRELGFTVRKHKTYTHLRGTEHQICLDFYDDAKESWFRLKYL